MLSHDEIVGRMSHPEGPLLERKPANVNAQEIRQTVVAFANSVADGEEAILFIGIRDDGAVEGCAAPDNMQKTVRECCAVRSYPPISYRIELLPEAKNVVAVVIPASKERPHFSGPAYVREGSQSVAASREVFDALIYSRNSKIAALQKIQKAGQVIGVVGLGHHLGSTWHVHEAHRESFDCKIVECNPHYVRFEVVQTSRKFSESLERITITTDEEKWRPELVIRGY